MKTKKTIGIVGWKTGDNSFGVTTPYLEFINHFGKPHIILPEDAPEEVKIDLLILPGGKDLESTAYGAAPGFNNSSVDPHKQYFYDTKLDSYIRMGIPIFGICLGFQMLCAKFGMKLTQDLLYHKHSTARWEEGHGLHFLTDPDNPLFSNVQTELLTKKNSKKSTKKDNLSYMVNSHHHQGVEFYRFNNNREEGDLQGIAISEDDFILEAVIHKTLPIAGVQWHPEEFYDVLAMQMVDSLLNNNNDEETERSAVQEESYS